MAIRRKVRNLIWKWHRLIGDPRLKPRFKGWEDSDCRSGVIVDPEYLTLECYFNEKRLQKELNEEQLDREMLHEVCHTLLWAICKRLEDAGVPPGEVRALEESTVTLIERAIWRIVKHGEQQNSSK